MTLQVTAVGRLDSDQVKSVLSAAVLAPSTHNTQPWRFRCTPSGIELHADTDRTLLVADADRRELVLSCGAALFNLRTAIHAVGVHPATTLLPRRDRPDLLAIVRPSSARTPDQRLVRLAKAIPQRHTNRTPFSPAAVPSQLISELRHAAEIEHAWLPQLDNRQLGELRELAYKSHQAQLDDPAFLDEWRRWTGRDRRSRDGVPADAGATTLDRDDAWVLRDFGTGGPGEPTARSTTDPLVVVIGSFTDECIDRLRAGQAMQRLLLTATAAGVDASFISQPVEVAPIREELRDLLGGGLWPQIVLRLGYGSPVSWTPRRELAEVLLDPGRPAI